MCDNFYYHTKLNVKECRKQIYDIIQLNWSLDFECRIKGKVSDNCDRFRLKNNIHCRNSFSRIFYGELINKEDGTVICGNFQVPILTEIFMTIWFSVLIFGFIVAFSDVDKFLGVIIGVPIIFIIGVIFVAYGIESSKKDEQYILKLLEKKLQVEK